MSNHDGIHFCSSLYVEPKVQLLQSILLKVKVQFHMCPLRAEQKFQPQQCILPSVAFYLSLGAMKAQQGSVACKYHYDIIIII